VIFKADCVNHNSEEFWTEICPQAPVFSSAPAKLQVLRQVILLPPQPAMPR
jgi:hypothetical protein